MDNGSLVTYETSQGQKISLSPDIVRKYLVSGNGNVTDQEVMMFLALCRYQRLNPFLREAYLVKFGSEPATIITGKEVFTKRAASLKECKGFEGGVIVRNTQGLEYRKGTLVLDDETLVGGWAKVYRQDWDVPLEITVSMSEYVRKKRDGTPMASWASMPATMIRKVALVQALREAFPEDFGGMYSPEEMPVDTQALSDTPVHIEDRPDAGNGPNNGNSITNAQIKRLFAIAKEAETSNDAIKAFMAEYYGIDSTKFLDKEKYEALCSAIEDGTVQAWYEAQNNDDAQPIIEGAEVTK